MRDAVRRCVGRKAGSRVSPFNTGERYERSCNAVELLAEGLGLGWTPEIAELALMSSGRHQPAQWRKYVVRHRLLGLGAETSVNITG